MFKTTMLAAFAAVSVCAMAQQYGQETNQYGIDSTGKSRYDIKREVCKQTEYLSAGDSYAFRDMLDRMPANTEDALLSGLFAARRQAILVRDQTIAGMFPHDDFVVANTSGTDRAAILAEESEGSMRPMRMIMQGQRPMDINYNEGFNILTVDLNATQTNQLSQWWQDPTNELEKDIVVRLLKIDAGRADLPIYPSLYMHHMYR